MLGQQLESCSERSLDTSAIHLRSNACSFFLSWNWSYWSLGLAGLFIPWLFSQLNVVKNCRYESGQPDMIMIVKLPLCIESRWLLLNIEAIEDSPPFFFWGLRMKLDVYLDEPSTSAVGPLLRAPKFQSIFRIFLSPATPYTTVPNPGSPLATYMYLVLQLTARSMHHQVV